MPPWDYIHPHLRERTLTWGESVLWQEISVGGRQIPPGGEGGGGAWEPYSTSEKSGSGVGSGAGASAKSVERAAVSVKGVPPAMRAVRARAIWGLTSAMSA